MSKPIHPSRGASGAKKVTIGGSRARTVNQRGTQHEIAATPAPPFSRVHRAQMSDDVADHLRTAIISKRLNPGTFIRLHETAAELGVSITPVREALLKLSSEGLVQREPHRGYTVLPLTGQDVRDICWLQDTIATELAATTAHRITNEQIDELERINDALAAAVNSADPDGIASAEGSFHELLAQASERIILTRFLLRAKHYLHAQIDIADPEFGQAALGSNRRLIATLRRRSTDRATEPELVCHRTEVAASKTDSLARRGDATRAIGIGQLRSDTLGYLDRVAAGEMIEVVRRGTVVARIIADQPRASFKHAAPESESRARAMPTTRVAVDQLRTRAGHYLDRVKAGEMLEIMRGHEIAAFVIRPDSS